MNSRRVVYVGECVRCSGDLYCSRDFYGEYMQCLQCGYVKDVAEKVELGSYLVGKAQKKAA